MYLIFKTSTFFLTSSWFNFMGGSVRNGKDESELETRSEVAFYGFEVLLNSLLLHEHLTSLRERCFDALS